MRGTYYLLVFVLLTYCANAQSGCRVTVSGTNYIYYGAGYALPRIQTTYNCPAIPTNPPTIYATNLVQTTVGSPIPLPIVCTAGGSIGTVYSFSIVQCPIDDCIPILILVSGGFGFFIIRRNSLNIGA